MNKNKTEKKWWVYLLRCSDGTLYCGSTNDLSRRINAHNTGRGAKYTRGKAPVKLVFKRRAASKAAAFSFEARIKRMTRSEKLQLM